MTPRTDNLFVDHRQFHLEIMINSSSWENRGF